jgi:hypothetical protein
LRAAWYESMLAMNQLKDFMMSQNTDLAQAFRWKSNTLPPKYKTGSVSYYQAVEVALISGLMFGAAMFFLQQAYYPINVITWIVCAGLGALTIYVQMLLYRQFLK